MFPKLNRINIGAATCGMAAGAQYLSQNLAERDWDNKATVVNVGCLGACYAEPLIDVRTAEGRHYFYGRVDRNSLWTIIKTAADEPSNKNLWAVAQERQTGLLHEIGDLELIQIENTGFQEFFQPQMRRITGRCGFLSPFSINEYVALDGYRALEKVPFNITPEKIIETITVGGLRGRGGAGFPTGAKMKIVAESPDPVRFIIANADEGDLGAYMDRALLESDPHAILEGLIIAAYAIGAPQGYIFIRHEYPLANIPWIIRHGADAFRSVGTTQSPGTKIFCLAGDVERMGVIEVPLGANSNDVVERIGGTEEQSVKALHIGGPSGGIVAYKSFAMDYESVSETGAIMGSGGLVALGKNRCIVDIARHMVNFLVNESCGKCLFCRDGLPELESLLIDLCLGQAGSDSIKEIGELSRAISDLSLCGLGQTAAHPVITSLKDFLPEYEAHIKGCCPTVNCKPLIDFEINLTSCRDCRACFLVCPSDAVKMRVGEKCYLVDQQRCIKCWACYETCPFDCIRITSEEFTWMQG